MSDAATMPHDEITRNPWQQAMALCAGIALVFCIIVLALLLINHIQSKRYDPLSTEHYYALQEKLVSNPQDEAVKQEIREIDLRVRREYFAAVRFAKLGALLLAGGLLIFLLCGEIARRLSSSLPVPNNRMAEREWVERVLARRAVIAMGVVMGGVLMSMASFSRHDQLAEYARALGEPTVHHVPESTTVAPFNPGSLPTLEKASPGDVGQSAQKSPAPLPSSPSTAASAPGAGLPLPAFPANWEKYWPHFRGPAGTGVVSEGLPYPQQWNGTTGEQVRWKSAIPLPGENSPIIWGSKIFLSGATKRQRQVYCFDRDTGKLLWTTDVIIPESATREAPAILEDTGYAAPTMATDGERVFAFFGNGDLIALDFSGKQLWARNFGTPDNVYGHATSLRLLADRLIIQYDQGHGGDEQKSAIFALLTENGKTLWHTPRSVPNSWSTPIYIIQNGRGEIITCADPWVIAYNPVNGQELWRVECLIGDVAPSPTFANGILYVAQQGASLTAIKAAGQGDISTTAILWQAHDSLPDTVSPVATSDYVFLVSYVTLTCFDARTGAVVWEHYFDDDFHASPTVAGTHLYLIDSIGVMHILEIGKSFKEIAALPLGEKVSATPAFVDGRIYIRGKKHLYCIGGQ